MIIEVLIFRSYGKLSWILWLFCLIVIIWKMEMGEFLKNYELDVMVYVLVK